MANDFSGDSNCKALYRFESGALTTDSIGTNTLTDINTVGTNASDFKEGAACADFERANGEFFSRTDANLDSGFPLKNGDTVKKISLCFWIKSETFGGTQYLFSKSDGPSNTRSFGVVMDSAGVIGLLNGYNSGNSFNIQTHATGISATTWYHVGIAHDGIAKTALIHIEDESGTTLGVDKSITWANETNVETAPLNIATVNSSSTFCYDGLMDELVIFDDILTTTEMGEIRAGTYGAGGGLTKALSDTITMSDTPLKVFGLNKDDSVTMSDELSNELGLNKDDTITLSDDLANTFGLNKDDTITLVESISKLVGINKDDTITMSDNINAIITLILALNDTITMSDSVTTKAVGSAQDDTITMSDNISYISAFLRTLSDTVNISDDLTKTFGVDFADTITMSDNFDALVALILALNDSITMSDSLTSKSIGLNKSDTISLSDDIIKAIGLTQADIITMSERFTTTADVIAALLDFVAENRVFNFTAENRNFNFNAKSRGSS